MLLVNFKRSQTDLKECTQHSYCFANFTFTSNLILIVGYIVGVGNQSETESHIFVVLPQRATSYTWTHMNITPSLLHSHTYLC